MVNNIEYLENMFRLVKLLKKDVVAVNSNGLILGTDYQFASISELVLFDDSYKPIHYSYIYNMKELSAFMKTIAECEKEYGYVNLNYMPTGIFLTTNRSKTRMPYLQQYYTLENMQQLYLNYINAKSQDVLHVIPEFNHELLSMKSADGSKMFNVDGYLMTSFNSIHPVNKSDNVELIFRYFDQYSYTAEFIIEKKKQKCEIHEMYRFRYL